MSIEVEKKCKTCKWWTGDPEDRAMGTLKACEQPKAKLGYQWAEKEIPSDGVWIENDEGRAWYMGPDFGCVNWEEGP